MIKKKKSKKDYEKITYGPITIERSGKNILFKSDFTKDEFKIFQKDIKNSRSEIENKINENISKVLSLIDNYHPLEFLSTISAKNIFGDPEHYSEVTHKGRECYVEYAQSLALCKEIKTRNHTTKNSLIDFENKIKEIFDNLLYYYSTESAEGKYNKAESELRVLSLIRYLFVRGDSIVEHYLEMIEEVFKEHDVFLKSNFGFTIKQIIEAIKNIENQLNKNVNQMIKPIILLKELKEDYEKFLKIIKTSNRKKQIEEFNSQPKIRDKIRTLFNLQAQVKEFPHIIIPNKKIPLKLLLLLSSSFGDNKPFLKFKKTPAWPTNNSIIYEKPIIKEGKNFYCFIPTVLFRNIGSILETLIMNKDINYFQNNYQKKRAKYLEKKALQYFKNILPKAKIFNELFYWVVENGTKNRVSTDGLILYDENLFIIEDKAGSLSTPARRGGLNDMRSEAKELIDNAYNQALRTKRFITETVKPEFEFKDGSTALIIINSNFSNKLLKKITAIQTLNFNN